MAVFRIEKTRDYTVMSNHHLKDRTLTLKSKGLLSMMLSLPDEWNYTTRGLAAICREGVDRNQLVQKIEEKGVQTRMLFAGNIVKQPCFDEMRASGKGYRVVGDLAVTDRIMKDTFWLGVYPGMTTEMLNYMVEKITETVSMPCD